MKRYELYSGDICLVAYDGEENAPALSYPIWLWSRGAILLGGQLIFCNDDLEMLIDGRRAWRMTLPEGAIERRKSPIQGTGCCRG